MIGAIAGDIIGSRFEFSNRLSTDFELFTPACEFTDDTVMTCAVAQALMHSREEGFADLSDRAILAMRRIGRRYPDCGYGARFYHWMFSRRPRPYSSFGNGSAMRVSAAGWLFDDLAETRHAAALTAEVSHNHPEGIKGAEAAAAAIFLARTGSSKAEIRAYTEREFGYDLSRTCAELRPGNHHDETCQVTIPLVFAAFLESTGFEDAIRNAVSLGGDTDTVACITGSIAEAFYGVPEEIAAEGRRRLPADLLDVLDRFQAAIGAHEANLHDAAECGALQGHICYEVGDITAMETDAIVNAANQTLLGGGGVDGAIHRAAGPALRKECMKLHGCKTGEAAITGGYRLKAKYIIHTVGPVYHAGDPNCAEQLFACCYNSMELAARFDVHSIAFPAISTGAYGYPNREAAKVILLALARWVYAHQDYPIRIVLVCYDYEMLECYRAAEKMLKTAAE
jgi:ADP-ribosylglycohydrolase/O-acetyl-ADP-ribose deacetylase (regulator of RNase III)